MHPTNLSHSPIFHKKTTEKYTTPIPPTHQSLRLLDYLVLNGSERVIGSTREHSYDLRSLENYSFTDELGRDQGVNGMMGGFRGMRKMVEEWFMGRLEGKFILIY